MSSSRRSGSLSVAQERMLWTAAQHMHGWCHVYTNRNGRAVADVLVREGLGTYGLNGREHHDPHFVLSDVGRTLVARRWSVSPVVVGGYELPAGAHCWDTAPDRRYTDDGTEFVAGVACHECGRFVGRDGRISIDRFEMSEIVAAVEGLCRRCIDALPPVDEGIGPAA